MPSEPEIKPARCGNCESYAIVKAKFSNLGDCKPLSQCQVVCWYCGAAGAIESTFTAAVQAWNSMWVPRPGDAHPTTRLLYQLAERDPWTRFGPRVRTKYCAYCGAWRTRGGVREPHSPNCPWAQARRALNMPGSANV